MKEKRVDILLAIASFFQLIFLGSSGSFAAEAMSDNPDEKIIFVTSLSALITMTVIIFVYLQTFSLTSSKNGS
jgi:hypothetical protein